MDQDICTGCQLCVEMCPEVFLMGDDAARVIVDEVPPDVADMCEEASENCPVEAIRIEP